MKFYTKKNLIICSICFLISGYIIGVLFNAKVFSALEKINVSKKIEVQNRDNTIAVVSPQKNFVSDELNNIEIYERYNSAVVNIATEVMSLNWFLEPTSEDGASGSGAIIDSKGYILTNTHVVDNAYKVYVTLSDGSQYEGKLVGKDIENDLAVLKIDVKDRELTAIPFGKSSNLKVGQKVLAIGNPFGYDRTLTQGIVSGIGRPIRTNKNLVIKNMIQTDAPINPGNSGGPLLDSTGNLIGINTMIYSPSGGSVGIGFAVPVDTAIRVLPDIIKYGKVIRGWIDIVPIQINSRIAQYAKFPISKGILISEISKTGAAYRSGLRGGSLDNPIRYGRQIFYFGGDLIYEVNGVAIDGIVDLFSALENSKPDDVVNVKFYRDNKKMELNVKLSERPKEFSW